MLFCLLAMEASTKPGECGALVVKGRISNPRYLVCVASTWCPRHCLVVRRRYLIVVHRPMPAAPRRYLIVVPRPLVVRRRYLIVVPRQLSYIGGTTEFFY